MGNGGLPKIEKKFLDFDISEVTIGATWETMVSTLGTSTSTMHVIARGSGPSARIGRKITLTKIQIRLNLEFIDASASSLLTAQTGHETVRFILVWDKQCNGAGISGTSYLAVDLYNAFRNISNGGRYVALHDKTYTFNRPTISAGDGTANDSQSVHKDWNINITKNVFIPIEYDDVVGNDGTIDEIKSNNVGLYVISRVGGRIRINTSKVRVRYIDY